MRSKRLETYVTIIVWLVATACHSWRPSAVPASQGASAWGDAEIKLTKLDGTEVRLRDARVSGDSIMGSTTRGNIEKSVALTDVRRVGIRRLSAKHTTVAVVGGIFGVAAVWALLLVNGEPITGY